MSRETCPICGRGTLRETTGVYETDFAGRNGEIHALRVPDVTWKECDRCNEVLLDEPASRRIEEVRRGALGLLSPSEIRRLRQRLKKNQGEMSELLGIGEKTYCRWESGAYVQSTAFDRYLRLLIERPENVDVLQRLGHTPPVASSALPEQATEIVFVHLQDTRRFEEAAEVFTQLLETGALHASPA